MQTSRNFWLFISFSIIIIVALVFFPFFLDKKIQTTQVIPTANLKKIIASGVSPPPRYSDDFLEQQSPYHFTNLVPITAQNLQNLKEVTHLSDSDKVALGNVIGFSNDGNIIFQQVTFEQNVAPALAKPIISTYEWNLTTGEKHKVSSKGNVIRSEMYGGIGIYFPELQVVELPRLDALFSLYDLKKDQEFESTKGEFFSTEVLNKNGTVIAATNAKGLFIIDAKTHVLIRYIPSSEKYLITMSDDGQIIAATDYRYGPDGKSKLPRLFVWRIADGKQIWESNAKDNIDDSSLNSTGTLLAYGSMKNNENNDLIHIVDLLTGKEIYHHSVQGSISSSFFTQDSKRLISFSGEEKWSTAQVENLQSFEQLPLPSKDVGVFTSNPNGDLFAGTNGDIIDAQTGKKIFTIPSKDRIDIDFFNLSGTLLFTTKWIKGVDGFVKTDNQIWRVE